MQPHYGVSGAVIEEVGDYETCIQKVLGRRVSRAKYLGFVFDKNLMIFFVPDSKQESSRKWTREVSKR